MFGRELRGNFPEVKTQPKHKDDTMIRCRDREQKQKMQQYADKRRHTAVIKIKVGDTVLCKQERKNSLTPLYDPGPMVVIGVKGSMITATNSVIRTRNYADWKLLKNGCREPPLCDDSDSGGAFKRTRLQLIGHVNSLNTQSNPERVGMQCQRTDPVNYDEIMSSQEQTATQLNTRVGRDLGSPDQTVTQSEDMRPRTGPEGEQNPQRTLNTKTLFANSEHLLLYYIRVCKGHKDIRTLRVISNIYFVWFIYL